MSISWVAIKQFPPEFLHVVSSIVTPLNVTWPIWQALDRIGTRPFWMTRCPITQQRNCCVLQLCNDTAFNRRAIACIHTRLIEATYAQSIFPSDMIYATRDFVYVNLFFILLLNDLLCQRRVQIYMAFNFLLRYFLFDKSRRFMTLIR